MKLNISDRWASKLWGLFILLFFLMSGAIIVMIIFKTGLAPERKGFLELIPYWAFVTMFFGVNFLIIYGILRSTFYRNILKIEMSKQHFIWVDKFPLEARCFFTSWRLKSRDEKAQFLREWYEHLSEVARNYVPPENWNHLKTDLTEVVSQLDRATRHLLDGDDFLARVWLHKAERSGKAVEDMCTAFEVVAEGGAA